MNWLKKQIYTKGPGSPGATAKAFARSHLTLRAKGMNKLEACDAVLQSYFFHYDRKGISVDGMRDIANEIEGDPALAVFVLVLLGNSNNMSALNKAREDAEIILKIILAEQNKVFNENRSFKELEEKLSRSTMI